MKLLASVAGTRERNPSECFAIIRSIILISVFTAVAEGLTGHAVGQCLRACLPYGHAVENQLLSASTLQRRTGTTDCTCTVKPSP